MAFLGASVFKVAFGQEEYIPSPCCQEGEVRTVCGGCSGEGMEEAEGV